MRFQKIINNKKYKKYLEELEQLERNRIYCRHGLNHSLDVTRICYIVLMEDNFMADKDIVYAVALLHDIGRCENYNHSDASVRIAKEILPECGYNDSEILTILEVIVNHSGALNSSSIEKLRQKKKLTLREYFKIADQISRNCFCCKVSPICKWDAEQKNKNVSI